MCMSSWAWADSLFAKRRNFSSLFRQWTASNSSPLRPSSSHTHNNFCLAPCQMPICRESSCWVASRNPSSHNHNMAVSNADICPSNDASPRVGFWGLEEDQKMRMGKFPDTNRGLEVIRRRKCSRTSARLYHLVLAESGLVNLERKQRSGTSQADTSHQRVRQPSRG